MARFPRHTTATGPYFHKRCTSRIWVPGYELLRTLLIQESHDNPTLGHFGVDKTTKMLQRNYYWPNMADDVRKHVSSCTACQIMKSSHLRAAGLLQPLDPPERPWQQVTMDYVTGLRPAPAETTPSSWSLTDSRKWRTSSPANRQSQPNKPRSCSSRTSSDCMACPLPSFQIETRNSRRISSATCGSSSAPNYRFPPPTTHRMTGKPNESTKLWNNSFGLPVLTHRHGRNPFRC
ncbi:hypothetical protein CLOP_g2425 [Closterium sp. NIES-67]|nr:hypothetical protein CLOP_g2425 [Closterium sp. NIES-67]